MTTDLAVVLLGAALIDSVNPSALALTLMLVATSRSAAIPLSYVAGVFAAYLAIGLAVLVGLGPALRSAIAAIAQPGAGAYAVEAGIAAVVLALALRARRRPLRRTRPRVPLSVSPARAVALGAGVTLVESTTALPYLAALGALAREQPPAAAAVVALLAYNAIFVLPPLALIGLARWRREALGRLVSRGRRVVQARPPWLAPAALALVAILLASDAVLGLAHGRGWL